MNPTVLHDEVIVELARSLAERGHAQAAVGRRMLLGIAGIPGAGKSTLAQRVASAAAEVMGKPASAVVLPMDGFHLTNDELRERGLYERKGAPETFAAERYVALLRRCRDARHVERFPFYDRALHEPRMDDEPSHAVSAATRVIVTEGNYLLLDRQPWSALADVLDETWLLDVPPEQAKQRIIARHERGGRSRDEAERHYAVVDRPNTELVLHASRAADRVVALHN